MQRFILRFLLFAGLLFGTMPPMTGCGTRLFDDLSESLDDLGEDLDDSDDLEEVGEAFDDFFDQITDD